MTFDADNGTDPTQVTVANGETVTRPEDPTKEGFTFLGWYNGEEVFDFETPITEDITLTAHWTVGQYTVTFNTDGGNEIEPIMAAYGTEIELPEPTKEGYRFLRWTDAEGNEYDIRDPYTVTGDITLTAVWEIKTYTVKFYDGDEILSEATVNHGAELPEVPATDREGYRFDGWYSDAELTEKAELPETVTSNLTFYGKWVKQYTLHFDNNGWEPGKTVADKTKDVNENGEAKVSISFTTDYLPNLTKDGTDYVFVGWATDPEAVYENIEYPVTGVDENYNRTIAQTTARQVVLTSDLTVYAIYEPLYTLTIDLNGGEGNVALTHSGNSGNVASFFGSTYVSTRKGYELIGFSTNKDATEPEIAYRSGSYWMHLTENTTLYLIWKANEYTLSFSANGGEGTVPEAIPFTVESDPVTLPGAGDLTKEGRKFLGWYDGSSISDLAAGKSLTSTQLKNFYEAGAEYELTAGNTTLLAVWQNVGVKVSYDLTGAVTSANKPMTKADALFDYGKANINLGTNGANYKAKAEGYTYPDNKNFTGLVAWYDEAHDTFYAFNKSWYTLDKTNTTLQEDGSYAMTLKAVWGYTPVVYHRTRRRREGRLHVPRLGADGRR